MFIQKKEKIIQNFPIKALKQTRKMTYSIKMNKTFLEKKFILILNK